MLTPTQIEARRDKLTASRIACLMTGDAEKIMRLWREMIGDEAPENLDDVWAVQLGLVTEQLNLDWFQIKNKLLITQRGEVRNHPAVSWGACTLDGWINEDDRGNGENTAVHSGLLANVAEGGQRSLTAACRLGQPRPP